jgi:2-keto-4-pentenoate hydratase
MDIERRDIMQYLAAQLAKAWPDPANPIYLERQMFPHNRNEAYFVQDEMHRQLGAPVVGWKVGATSQKMRELDGHDDVIPGRIFASRTFIGSRHNLRIDQFPNARAETEFAFRLTETPKPRSATWTADEMMEIMVLHPAIELIGNRFRADPANKAENSLLTIADNGGGIGFVFGDPIADWHAFDFQNHQITLSVSGGPPADNFLGEMRCVPAQAAADLVNHLASRNVVLQAGDFISTGAATVPQPFAAGDVVRADFGAFGQIELNF